MRLLDQISELQEIITQLKFQIERLEMCVKHHNTMLAQANDRERLRLTGFRDFLTEEKTRLQEQTNLLINVTNSLRRQLG